MSPLSADVKKMLSKTRLQVFAGDYVAVYLPTGTKVIPGEWFRPVTTPFAAVIQEPELVTMIVPRRKWLRMKSMFDAYDVSGLLKVMTFDVKRSLAAGRFRVAIATALAEAGIESIPVSSFKCYHVIVPKPDLPRAVRILRGLIEDAGGRKRARSKK